MCEKKRRWMSKDEADSRIAFSVWTDFLKYVSPNTKKTKSFEDFVCSCISHRVPLYSFVHLISKNFNLIRV